MSEPVKELDLKGLKCPLPVLHTRRALIRLGAGERLIVLCTDPLAAIDIPHLVRELGDALEESHKQDGVIVFRILRRAR
ncbi:MAG: sulfurtransferase TusA family protein [Methylovirgula sp.]|nr:sulfurtransferase TusA family protein [Methylovirgula sp.]